MRHLLSLLDLTGDDVWSLLHTAVDLKTEWQRGGNPPLLAGKTLGMVFQKPSLRTRVSFDVAMQHLGGHAIMLGPSEIGLGTRESVADVARVLSEYVQAIMARVFAHAHVEELAACARVPVINGLSDDHHPCQTLADLLTLHEHFGDLAGLCVAYVGDGNNVAASLMLGCAAVGADFRVASPKGYALPDALVAAARARGGQVSTCVAPSEAVADADVVYTDTWVSMGQEAEAAVRAPLFVPYQVNAALLAQAAPHAVVLHCLPAHRGEEITSDVADGPQSLIFQQAGNRLHAQKAVLMKVLSA